LNEVVRRLVHRRYTDESWEVGGCIRHPDWIRPVLPCDRDAHGQFLEPMEIARREGAEDGEELGSLPEAKVVASVENLTALVVYLLARAQKANCGIVLFVNSQGLAVKVDRIRADEGISVYLTRSSAGRARK
jgi:hypothetical protein